MSRRKNKFVTYWTIRNVLVFPITLITKVPLSLLSLGFGHISKFLEVLSELCPALEGVDTKFAKEYKQTQKSCPRKK